MWTGVESVCGPASVVYQHYSRYCYCWYWLRRGRGSWLGTVDVVVGVDGVVVVVVVVDVVVDVVVVVVVVGTEARRDVRRDGRGARLSCDLGIDDLETGALGRLGLQSGLQSSRPKSRQTSSTFASTRMPRFL